MLNSKKVAIIGAGPSGLVAAKSLLHNYPHGTFSPVIFEKRSEIGGLWPTERPDTHSNSSSRDHGVVVDPYMRTNLSRFSVAFSDLSWESVIEDGNIPMFPRAWQVGRYLKKYAERYLPPDVLRLRCRVARTVRETQTKSMPRWTVESIAANGEEQKEQFDFLIVASGYFSRPHTPDIPGLEGFRDKTVHSSALNNPYDIQQLIERPGMTGGKVIVIGGSMSGAEAASALALHLSSANHSSPTRPRHEYEVHHICTRPFWTVPTYLPYKVSKGTFITEERGFLPLDLVFYDLDRRPPGQIEYAFGPLPPHQPAKVNEYFRSLFGREYGKIGNVGVNLDATEKEGAQPSWVAIGDDYAEYVRSGMVKPTIGRVCAVHNNKKGQARIELRLPDGKTGKLDQVAAIVTATGFTPFGSLNFLPADVLSTLEFSPTEPFLPLVLDGKGSTHAEIPDIGFVGFYRGPYWGAMEMQAKNIAETWYQHGLKNDFHLSEQQLKDKNQEREKVREFRRADPTLQRGQFPMADYVGLMESFAKDLGIQRAPLEGLGEQSGPVVPARYTMKKSDTEPLHQDILPGNDVSAVLGSLTDILFHKSDQPSMASAVAAFRALHGQWRFSRSIAGNEEDSLHKTTESSGAATFYPRYPSGPGYEKEYVYEERSNGRAVDVESRFIYRLVEQENISSDAQIEIWVSNFDGAVDASALSLSLSVMPMQAMFDETNSSQEFFVHARECPIPTKTSNLSTGLHYTYAFNFEGVAISSWVCTVYDTLAHHGEKAFKSRTVYVRD